MKIGAPREVFPGEARVAMTPDSAAALQKLGHTLLLVEAGRGRIDCAYKNAGFSVRRLVRGLGSMVSIQPHWQPDVSMCVQNHSGTPFRYGV